MTIVVLFLVLFLRDVWQDIDCGPLSKNWFAKVKQPFNQRTMFEPIAGRLPTLLLKGITAIIIFIITHYDSFLLLHCFLCLTSSLVLRHVT